ncbi:endoplasmic reticulum resident protein 29 [Coccinella septempunctata]|uniref:endoplasmic reticulum resident protein 29 n=1 Tax=Coccinella septempunctata TaxID=41139 RepID=UPI001D06FCF7|nr:endoplasmic reticulum resident protein 29 [Coccinella septempunctata]
MYSYLKSSLVLFSILLSLKLAECCKGCVNLDEHNFNKIISRFKVALIKFDMAYPYGEKHDVFTKFAEEIADNKNLIVGEVGVKDYGEKDNEELAKKYGIQSKEDFPALKLFINGVTNQAKSFPVKDKWDTEMIRNFVKDNSDIYIGLPGCLERMDQLAEEFIKADDKDEKYKEIEKETHSLVEKEKDTATTYLKYMKRVLSNGVSFIKQETNRLKKLLKESNIQEKKKQDLSNRLNILKSFHVLGTKDEL